MNETDEDNLDKLVKHLDEGSLARLLVERYRAAVPGDATEELTRFVKDRLNEKRAEFNAPDKD